MQNINEKDNAAKTSYGLDKAIDTIQDAISNKRPEKKLNIAIISLPYGGKSELVDEIIYLYPREVSRVTFSSITDGKNRPSIPEKRERIMIFDNCHYLYARKIGGFEQIEDFLSRISSSDGEICISTWNLHSWNYLVQVLDLDKYFTMHVYTPSLEQNEIRDFLLSSHNKDIQFINDSEEHYKKLIYFLKNPLVKKLTNNKLNLYNFHINFSYLISILKRKNNEDPESVIFKEITKLSYGNPGIAKNIWKEWFDDDNTMKTSNVKKAYADIDLDDTGRFILFLIIATGHINQEEIAAIVNSGDTNDDLLINKVLFQLSRIDVITKINGYYSIKPEMIYSVIRYLEDVRMVW